MVHLWLCAPFLLIWVYQPSVRTEIPEPSFPAIWTLVGVVVVYLAVRTWLAFRDPAWLDWELVFPPIDVAVVSLFIFLGNRDPLSNVALLYLFPLAEAAGRLSWRWSTAVGAMVLVGAALATRGMQSEDPFNTAFRYYFLIVVASLIAALANAGARVLSILEVARDRERIAMEMHDGVQGHLVGVSAQLELVERLASRDPQRASAIAAGCRETTRLAADELRFLVQRMRAPSAEQGFLTGLRQFAHHLTERAGLDLVFDVEGEPSDLSPDWENAFFRTAQESLTNIVRHARAKRVEIRLQYSPQSLRMQIVDDGRGFDPDDPAHRDGTHAGLDGMRKRLASLGGTVDVRSEVGRGTKITVTGALRPKRERGLAAGSSAAANTSRG